MSRFVKTYQSITCLAKKKGLYIECKVYVYRQNTTCVIKDPLGQTPCLTSSDHYIIWFCFEDFEWTDGRKHDVCENRDHHRPRDCGLAKWISSINSGMPAIFFSDSVTWATVIGQGCYRFSYDQSTASYFLDQHFISCCSCSFNSKHISPMHNIFW